LSNHVLSLSLLTVAALATAPLAQAADSTTPPLAGAGTAPTTVSAESSSTHSWEMPALTVGAVSDVREAQRIGSYGQPRWSARRLFTETRTYVIPEGQIEFEYWLTVQDHKRGDKDGDVEIKQMYEVEIGLPYRFQLDLYQKYVKEGSTGTSQLDSTKFEVRWAFANWDVLWANPTAYIEWTQSNNDYDFVEGKLLFCDELTDRLRWAANLVWEEKTGGDRERSREVTGGLSYGVIDSKVAMGAEFKVGFVDSIDQGERTDVEKEILLGPSAQFRPLPAMHIDAAVLAGLTDESPVTKTTVIAGWEF
jgi:hypothetical protein